MHTQDDIFLPHAVSSDMNGRANRQVAFWLMAVAILVFSMVVLGGVTRLTNSGLSMVEWRPVTGWLPPLSEESWQAEFDKYKLFPEYRKVNQGMDLAGFKQIFAFEYAHRVLGRLIGLTFLLPFLYFLFRGKLERGLIPKLAGLFVLGGLQGGMGWFMVKSGLVDHPDVSHYRLTAHLALACMIFSGLLWVAFGLIWPSARPVPEGWRSLRLWSRMLLCLVAVQLLAGGLVAGLNAGFVYNEWPLMGDGFIPSDIGHLTPWYLNPLENVATIQFDHRIIAYLLLAAAVLLFISSRGLDLPRRLRGAIHLALTALGAQVALGIAALVHVVPVGLGALHQGGGLAVLAAVLFLVHQSGAERS